MGVEGGLSVLGTTGLVEPWDDHLEESMRERISTSRNMVLTTGRIGIRYARLLYPDHDIILVGGKIGEALDAAKGEATLFGLPGPYCDTLTLAYWKARDFQPSRNMLLHLHFRRR